jgi:hypothetical protein
MHAGKSLPVAAAGLVVFSLRGKIHMSSITSALSGLLTSPSFHGHGHKRGAHSTSSSTSSSASSSSAASTSGNSIGQLPVGASTALFSGLVQSFEQAIGSQSTSAVTGAGATAATQAASAGTAAASGAPTLTPSAATPAQGQKLQAFQHSLVQALKQDGLTSNGTGNVVSSLQSLIQQLGPNGKPTAATETLSSTFQNLVNGVSGSAATAASGSSSSGSANSGLQSFLNNLLQNVQASGAQSLTSAGSNVNTHV